MNATMIATMARITHILSFVLSLSFPLLTLFWSSGLLKTLRTKNHLVFSCDLSTWRLEEYLEMAKDNKQQQILAPPKHERGLRKTGYTITGYPFSQFGIPIILHAKKVRLEGQVWKETEADCGGIEGRQSLGQRHPKWLRNRHRITMPRLQIHGFDPDSIRGS